MSEEYEVGKTYLVFPFSDITWMENKWIIGKITAIDKMPSGCFLTVDIIESSSSYKYSITPHRVYCKSITLGTKDKEIKNETDLLFAHIDTEEIEDDNNKYEYTSGCSNNFAGYASRSP